MIPGLNIEKSIPYIDSYIHNLFEQNYSIEGKTFLDMAREFHKSGNTQVLWEPAPERVYSLSLLRKLIKKLSKVWMTPAMAILEVGSGKLESDGRSHISRLMPPKIAQQVTHSDLNRAASNDQPNFMQADLVTLSQTVGKCAYDLIFGSCVFDTLHRKDLTQALKEVRESLKERGRFIHISDLSFYFNALTDDLTKEEKLIFPFEDKHSIGLQVISPQQFQSYLETSTLPSEKKSFLTWFANLKPTRREQLVSVLVEKIGDLNFLSFGKDFSRWIENLKIPGMQKVLNHVSFPQKLKSSLKEAGFKIQVYKNKEITSIKDEFEEPYNFFSFSNRGFTPRKIYVLAPGKTYYTLTVHLLVAEK